VERVIRGFRQDDAGEWVAELACGHAQHVRHRPPFQVRPWVLDDAERAARVGQRLECPLCDRSDGGDPACWAGMICPTCGGADAHRPGCQTLA
jgi:hypothetical protein